MIALDYPAPFIKGTMIHRSIVLRIPLLLLQAFLAILFYQVCGHIILLDALDANLYRARMVLYGL